MGLVKTARGQTPERQAYMRGYYERKRTTLLAQAAARYAADPAPIIAKTKKWKAENPEASTASARRRLAANRPAVNAGKSIAKKARRAKNPEKYRAIDSAYMRLRYDTDPVFRMRKVLRARVGAAMRGLSKSARTMEMLGCSIPELRQHLEAQWLPGMNWENYGAGPDKWEMDHVVACATFDLSDPEQQRRCFGFKNVQPMWGIDNRKKGTK